MHKPLVMIGRWYSSEFTIKKSEVTPFHPHDARNRCAESLYPFSLQSLEWRMANLFVHNVLYHTLKFMLTSNSNYRRFFSLKVDLHFFTSSTVEEQVSYGGEVVGESAMKRVEDIGNEVIHKYYVWAL